MSSPKNFISKIKSHGIKGSSKIISEKINLLSDSITIRLSKYDFSREEKLLKRTTCILDERLNQNCVKFNSDAVKDLDFEIDDIGFLLGKQFHFKKNINWKFTTKDASASFPYIPSPLIDIMDYKKYGDYRITWELNRHHHFVWYAQKYFLSKNEKYFTSFITEITDWINQNKTGYGVNFTSSMEIAIRLLNWFVCFNIFYAGKKENFLDNKIINSILSQLYFLNENLTVDNADGRNNHSIVELSCLFIFQNIFNWGKLKSKDEILKDLIAELKIQFYDDGLNFEHSPTYSRFTIESLLLILIFSNKKNAYALSDLTHQYISSTRHFLFYNNTFPQFSDNDNGRILFLCGTRKNFNDQKGFFDFCGIFFNDEIISTGSINEINSETKWWTFLSGKILLTNKNANSNIQESIHFKDSGYWIYKNEKIELIFKSGYPGNKNLDFEYAPHIHNDLLSFVLFIDHNPVFIDSGTFTYDLNDGNHREFFRSIRSHNSICVNKQEQVIHTGPFGAKKLPDVSLEKIKNNDFVGKIFYKNGVEISRQIKVLNNEIELIDAVKSHDKLNTIEIFLILNPDLSPSIEDGEKIILQGKQPLVIEYDGINLTSGSIEEHFISRSYNEMKKSKKIIFTFTNADKEFEFNWKIKNFKNEN